MLRKIAFHTVTTVSTFLIKSHVLVFDSLVNIQVALNNMSRQLVANVSLILMRAIEPELMKMLEQNDEQMQGKTPETVRFNIELHLLQTAYEVRNHAKENGWNDNHSLAINALANSLLSECEWEEDQIHAKMKEIIESIEGLEYTVEDDPDF